MKVVFAIFFFLSASTVFAQTTGSWPAYLPDEYKNEMILIQTGFESPEVPPPDFRRWKAALGDIKLQEHELYSIAGRMDEFRSARLYHRTTVSLLIISPVVFVASAGFALVNLFTEGTTLLSPVLMVGSVVTFIIGLVRIGKNWSTLSDVNPVVTDYNHRLMSIQW